MAMRVLGRTAYPFALSWDGMTTGEVPIGGDGLGKSVVGLPRGTAPEQRCAER